MVATYLSNTVSFFKNKITSIDICFRRDLQLYYKVQCIFLFFRCFPKHPDALNITGTLLDRAFDYLKHYIEKISTVLFSVRTSDSLNEGLPIKMARKKFHGNR